MTAWLFKAEPGVGEEGEVGDYQGLRRGEKERVQANKELPYIYKSVLPGRRRREGRAVTVCKGALTALRVHSVRRKKCPPRQRGGGGDREGR